MAKNKGKSSKKGKNENEEIDFGDPSSKEFNGEYWEKEDDLDELIAFVNPDSQDVDTIHGNATAATCDYIVILTGDNENKVHEDQMVYGAMLAPAIYGSLAPSGIVLGRLGQGEAKKGKNAPWTLDEASKKDKARAQKWFTKYAKRKGSGWRINVDKLPL